MRNMKIFFYAINQRHAVVFNLPWFDIATRCYCNMLQESHCLQIVQRLVDFSNMFLLPH